MFVVTLPPSAAPRAGAFSRKMKNAGADILEIRGDLTPDIGSFRSALPLLLSPRNHRLNPGLRADYLDVEHDEGIPVSLHEHPLRIIRSFHQYEFTPSLERLQAIVSDMQRHDAWAYKIATFIREYDDLVILQRLQEWMNARRLRSIVLGMGPQAHYSRVTSVVRNVFTYAAPDEGTLSAPGQLPLSLYRLTLRRKRPKVFGIIGGLQIQRSLSPVIHNALFQRHAVDALYTSFPTTSFRPTIRTIKRLGLSGFSVTAPFKHEALRLAGKKDPMASAIGAVNTLVRTPRGWKGFNTDWYGILHGYPTLKKARSVAILGAGGAAQSAVIAARDANPKADIVVYARDVAKATKALTHLHVSVRYISDARATNADVVLCTVSADVALSFPNPTSAKAVAIDLRYGSETTFLRAAKKAGYITYDGIPMLIHQALQQFRHFTGKKPGVGDARMLASLLSPFTHGK